MDKRQRSFYFSFGLAVAIGLTLLVLKNIQRSARTEGEKGYGPSLPVDDLVPGSHRMVTDVYPGASNPGGRNILLLRKGDGTLRAWTIPTQMGQPTAPGGDWFTPGQVCEPFEVDTQREEVRCTMRLVDDRSTVLRWSWDGKSLDQLAPHMRAVPGHEEKGRFRFDIETPSVSKHGMSSR
jgi:hypothetical protein